MESGIKFFPSWAYTFFICEACARKHGGVLKTPEPIKHGSDRCRYCGETVDFIRTLSDFIWKDEA